MSTSRGRTRTTSGRPRTTGLTGRAPTTRLSGLGSVSLNWSLRGCRENDCNGLFCSGSFLSFFRRLRTEADCSRCSNHVRRAHHKTRCQEGLGRSGTTGSASVHFACGARRVRGQASSTLRCSRSHVEHKRWTSSRGSSAEGASRSSCFSCVNQRWHRGRNRHRCCLHLSETWSTTNFTCRSCSHACSSTSDVAWRDCKT